MGQVRYFTFRSLRKHSLDLSARTGPYKIRDKTNVRRLSPWLLFLDVHVAIAAADKPQLCNTELCQLVSAVQRTYVQRVIDNGCNSSHWWRTAKRADEKACSWATWAIGYRRSSNAATTASLALVTYTCFVLSNMLAHAWFPLLW